MSFVEIKGIKKHFGEGDSRVEVLKGIDLSIEKGEMCVAWAERFGQVNASSYPRRCRCADKRQCCY